MKISSDIPALLFFPFCLTPPPRPNAVSISVLFVTHTARFPAGLYRPAGRAVPDEQQSQAAQGDEGGGCGEVSRGGVTPGQGWGHTLRVTHWAGAGLPPGVTPGVGAHPWVTPDWDGVTPRSQ